MTGKPTTAQLDEIEQAAQAEIDGRGRPTPIGRIRSEFEDYLRATPAETTLALVTEIRQLRDDLATLRDTDTDATSRFAASPHLEAKWHPQLRRLMRERDQALAERDEIAAALTWARSEMRKLRATVEQVRMIRASRDYAEAQLALIDEALGEDA